MSTRPVPQVGFSFEYLMWIFTRLSGIAMFLLALVGLISALLMGARTQMGIGDLLRWTFFPNSHHVINTNIPDVDPGWLNAYWNTMQMLVVFFAVTHGMNGLRIVIEDYVKRPWVRIFLRGLVFLLWLFMLIVATYVILTV